MIRDAMASTRTVGISRLVMYRRERAVMLEPRDNGIVLWTLRYGDEVRPEDEYFDDLGKTKPDSELMKLVAKLIDARTKPWDPAMVNDPVQDRLLDIIASKKKGRKRPPKAAPAPEPRGNVVSIMDALRQSLSSESKAGKRR